MLDLADDAAVVRARVQAVHANGAAVGTSGTTAEDGYVLRVFDAFGKGVWSDEVGAVTGSSTVTHTYAGPELEAGMLYQFRVTSFREGNNGSRTNISASEDLKVVFIFVPTALP